MNIFFRCLLLVVFCLSSPVLQAQWLRDEQAIMGTEVAVELWASASDEGRALIDEVMAEFRRLDQMMNPWNDDSLVARVNREAAQQAVVITPELAEVVQA